jgi:hypothetical protein
VSVQVIGYGDGKGGVVAIASARCLLLYIFGPPAKTFTGTISLFHVLKHMAQSFKRIALALGSCWFLPVAASGGTDAKVIDYDGPAAWVCHPGKARACSDALDASIIHKDGRVELEPWRLNPAPGIDCFYVYPTVSNDRAPNSDLNPGADEELKAVREQFQRFGSQCRLFAPLYRQRTIPSIMAQVQQGDPRIAYGDIKEAWAAYLRFVPQNRGVVLIGHSQGADLLKRLIKEEIDAKPAQARLISAILLGTSVAVPAGKAVGGDFKTIPACQAPRQTQCVISYSAFRKSAPPTMGAAYGRHSAAGHTLCSNPAALEGGTGSLKAYFPSRRVNPAAGSTRQNETAWLKSGAHIQTGFVTLPGMLTSRCIQDSSSSYLEVSVHGDPADQRESDIGGDMVFNGRIQPQWGLHLIDMHLAIGNLVDIVGQQAAAYMKR